TTPTWNIFQKIGFRFFFIHVILYVFPFPLDAFSFLQTNVTQFLSDTVWGNLIPFIGDTFFGLELPSQSPITGSGDMTYNYVHLFSCVFLALIGALIWTAIDRKRKNYIKLLRFLVIYMAYYVLFSMLSYGFYKVFPLQFPAPSLGRLIQPYGDSSPMGIAWTFMGASKAYVMFSGAAEILAGLLLIFRRTRTFGGLVAFGVMLNVFMMNMCYDIPVKTYSFHLMFFGLFIFLQDWKRVFAVFFTKAATTARSFPAYFSKGVTINSNNKAEDDAEASEESESQASKKSFHLSAKQLNTGAIVLKVLLIGYFLYATFSQALEANATYGPNVPKPPMYGIYEIELYQKNKDTIPLLITNDTLWRRVIFQRPKILNAYRMDGRGAWLPMELDTVAKTIEIINPRDSTTAYSFKYTLKDSILTLDGTQKSDTLFIKAKQFDLKKFRLISRGFNWINEYPYNR
ncbi:MAG: hypothetical protein AAF617_14085, partial [Bacteroidota bacterium]